MNLSSIKAMMFDIDGTLINEECVMSKAMYETLIKLKQKGIKLAINTGRAFFSANSVLDFNNKSNELFDYFFCSNGTEIYDPVNKKLSYFGIVKKEEAIKLDEYFHEDYLTVAYYSDDKYLNCGHLIKDQDSFKHWLDKRFVKGRIIDFKKQAIDSPKYILLFLPKYLNEVEKKIAELNHKGIDIVKSGPEVYEIVAEGHSKGSAVNEYAKLLKINKKEILCFGDQEADVKALVEGVGCIMNNYEYKVKYDIPYICDSVDNDGIPKFLKENELI